jgi:hypothetical protein
VDGLWLRFWPPPPELSGQESDESVELMLDTETS